MTARRLAQLLVGFAALASLAPAGAAARTEAALGALASVVETERALERVSIPDATGDGGSAPDITRVTVGSHRGGTITWIVEVSNRTRIQEGDVVGILIDVDANEATGQQPGGIDYATLFGGGRDPALFRWSGTRLEPVQPAALTSLDGYFFRGFRISVNKVELGGVPGGKIRFYVGTQSGTQTDQAPDATVLEYQLSTQPLRLRVAGVATSPRVPRAGRPFAVAIGVHRSDLGELLSTGRVRCTARLGRRALRARASGYVEEGAVCRWTLPRNARNKRFRVTISVTFDGVTVRRSLTFRVR